MFARRITEIPLVILFTVITIYINVSAIPTGVNPVRRNNESQPLVRFNSNGTLNIVQFTDLHYGEHPASIGPEVDFNSTRVIADILDWEHPDFVIFTGDLVTGDYIPGNASAYIRMLLQPVVENGYRWASTYGNHDTGPLVSREEILQTEQSYGDLCYTKQMTPSNVPGVTNYYIPIYAPKPENGKTHTNQEDENPVMLWWFLDSQGGYTGDGTWLIREPFYIDQEVVYWFGNESRRLRGQWGLLPSLVFFHIPAVEYVEVQEEVLNNRLCSGMVDDTVTPQEEDTSIMNALLSAGGVRTIFVGHDHGNAWCCFYKGIQLCYNRHSGYGGYGNWTRGARIIKLDYNHSGSQTNYIRLETGEIVDAFPAHEK